MVNLAELEKLKNEVFIGREAKELDDLSDVQIVGITLTEKVQSLFSQMRNPYTFIVGKTTVHISFCESGKPLNELLKEYFIGLKS